MFGEAKKGAEAPLRSEKPPLGEARDVAARDDQVIEHADVDERQRLA
jgi:hypothetical protein